MAFTLVESGYEKVPGFLCATVVGFSDSIEYAQLDDELRKLAASFAPRLLRTW